MRMTRPPVHEFSVLVETPTGKTRRVTGAYLAGGTLILRTGK